MFPTVAGLDLQLIMFSYPIALLIGGPWATAGHRKYSGYWKKFNYCTGQRFLPDLEFFCGIYENMLDLDIKGKGSRRIRTQDPMISSPTLSPLSQRLQLPNPRKIFAIYALTLLMYTVASPDPNPRGGGQLPNPNECSSTLTSATRQETLTPNPNKCNSTLTSGTSGGAAPTYTIYTGEGVTLTSAILH